MKKRVCVIGCLGKMGQVICRGLLSSKDYFLAGGVDLARAGDDLGLILNSGNLDIPVSDNIQETLVEGKIDFAIDFTNPTVVVKNVAICLENHVPVLVGTTGISDEDKEKLHNLAMKTSTPVLVVPNFAIGALLMMKFAEKIVEYMPNAEIIELHNPQKRDRPSGTAIRTREIMLKAMEKNDLDDPLLIPIHSVRLPGFVAHQEIIFGDIGQALTIRHDSFQRESFFPGVLLGLKQLPQIEGLKVGLEI